MTEIELIELLHKRRKERGYHEEIPDWDFIEEDGRTLAEVNREEKELKKSQQSDIDKMYERLHENRKRGDREEIEDVDIEKSDELKGGLADKLSIEQIAEKHKVPLEKIMKQVKKGLKVEMEHTDDKNIALSIVKDHLSEFCDYYMRLDKMETEAKKEEKQDEK